jgi:hypothetical protein
MSDWEIVRHQVAISGRVTDAQTGRAIAGARVSLDSGPETFTAADGHFHFLDLPPGPYTLQASVPGAGTRYGPAPMTVTVKWDDQGKITLAIADLALSPRTGQAGGEQPPPTARRRRGKKSRE